MRIFKTFFTLIFGLALAYTLVCILNKDNPSAFGQAVNQFSIFVKEEPKYVKIDNAKGKDKAGYGNYEYALTGYDPNGNSHPVEFTGHEKLKQDHYLRLDTKGSYVITYSEAFENEMPKDVFNKLNQE